MKKKFTVVVALGFVLAGSVAAQASALTSLASYRQQNDSVGRKMPVSDARIFSVDEENAPPILGGSVSLINARGSSNVFSSKLPYTAGNLVVFENGSEKAMVRTGLSGLAGGTDQFFTDGSISLINAGGISNVSSSKFPDTAGNLAIRSAGNLVVFENGSEETMVRTSLSGLSGGTDQFFTGGSISLINAGGISNVSSSKLLPYTGGNLVFNIDTEMTMLETNMSTRANISVPVFSDIPVLPAGSLDVELTAMNPLYVSFY